MRLQLGVGAAALALFSFPVQAADTVASLQDKAKQALAAKQGEQAVNFAGMAIALEPQNAGTYMFRGLVFESLQRHAEAVKDFDKAVELKPDLAEAYQQR